MERLITVERALELGLGRHPELHADVREMEEVLPDAEGRGGMSIAALVRRTRRHEPGPGHRRRGAGSGGRRDAVCDGPRQRWITVDDPCPRCRGGVQPDRHLRRAVRGPRIRGGALADRRRDRLRGVRGEEPAAGRPPRASREVLEVSGFTDGRVARSPIFVPSPIDGRAVRAEETAISSDRARRLGATGWRDRIAQWSVPTPDRRW